LKKYLENCTKGASTFLLTRKNLNTLLNIKAFLLVARSGSFSAAARELSVAPSVITKRITQLEDQMHTTLFIRSTRGLGLTTAGERLLPRYQRVIAELDEIIDTAAESQPGIEGNLRIKSPTTVTSLYLGKLFSEFHSQHPGLSMDIVLLDRSVNPLEEGFDVVFAARPASYPHVVDTPLCRYPLGLCASPAYLQKAGEPHHPTELGDHECLTSVLQGTNWVFESASGALSVEVRSKFHANDGQVLREAARQGLGLAILPEYLLAEDFRCGRLVSLLPDYPVTAFWFKVLVPRIKMSNPAIHELVTFLKARMQPAPPWEIADTDHRTTTSRPAETTS
jgi:DNA-binding transcriptional LysR family regulator